MVDQIQEQTSATDHVEALRHSLEGVSRDNRIVPIGIALGLAILIATGAILFVVFVGSRNNTAALATQEQDNTTLALSRAPGPEPQTAPAPVVAKEWPKVGLKWVEIATVRTGYEIPTIPWDKLIFMPGAKAVSELHYPSASSHGFGDGTAFVMTNSPGWWEKEKVEVSFTPDKGATWFGVANPYPGRSSTPPDVVGAFLEGNTLVLYIALQSQPWVYTYWRADIPLATIEGLSP